MRDRALRKQRLPRLLVSFALLAVIAGFAGVSSSQELQQDAATKKAAGDDGPEVAEKKRLEAELADTADRAPAKSLKSSDEQKDVESGQVETSSRRGVMLAGLTIFVLAIFVGFEMITKVPPTLHTPLMSGSNAISGITVVGALIVAGCNGDDESASTTVEDSVDEFGVFFFGVAEYLDRQVGGGGVEEGLGELGGVVAIGGASGLSALLASCDEAGGSERAQMLSDGARGDPQRRGQLIGGCLATSLQCPEHAPLRGRRCDVGRVHSTKATTGSQVYERYAR